MQVPTIVVQNTSGDDLGVATLVPTVTSYVDAIQAMFLLAAPVGPLSFVVALFSAWGRDEGRGLQR
jgi:hypothetical protein